MSGSELLPKTLESLFALVDSKEIADHVLKRLQCKKFVKENIETFKQLKEFMPIILHPWERQKTNSNDIHVQGLLDNEKQEVQMSNSFNCIEIMMWFNEKSELNYIYGVQANKKSPLLPLKDYCISHHLDYEKYSVNLDNMMQGFLDNFNIKREQDKNLSIHGKAVDLPAFIKKINTAQGNDFSKALAANLAAAKILSNDGTVKLTATNEKMQYQLDPNMPKLG